MDVAPLLTWARVLLMLFVCLSPFLLAVALWAIFGADKLSKWLGLKR
jgi:hypothetical protein